MPTSGPLAEGGRRTKPDGGRRTYGKPAKKPRIYKSIAALVNRLDTAQRVLSNMDKSPEPARAAVQARITQLEEEIIASQAWYDKQASDARQFVKQLAADRVEKMGLSGAIDVDKIELP